MKSESIWKKIFLLTIGTMFALHLQMAKAQNDSDTIKINEDETECVIRDDQ
jgi:hypothetical protein